jgi:Trk K+ transport system NAD-binding subunit
MFSIVDRGETKTKSLYNKDSSTLHTFGEYILPYSQLLAATNVKRPPRRLRFLRAIWRDTRALWNEFSVPILMFLITTIGGGYLYGELYFRARGEVIAMIDRPYVMLQLMILESPEGGVPPEWYLVIFWYALPVIFVFVIGRGVADFVRLFFNRDARLEAWREAVASTYRRHIIIFGAGHVGMRVIFVLYQMGLDIVVIDNSPDPGVEDALTNMKIPLINADGRQSAILEKAGIRHAESFVICTGDDHVNLEAVMRARDMNTDIRIVARVWDGQFAKQIKNFMNVQSVLSSSDLAAPAFAGSALGIEITQTLRINDMDYSMIRIDVSAGSFLDGATIGDLQKKNDMDIVLHGHIEDVVVQPKREVVVKSGDTLVIFARHDNVMNIVARNRPNSRVKQLS